MPSLVVLYHIIWIYCRRLSLYNAGLPGLSRCIAPLVLCWN
jgi:hypothetical protein